MPSCQLSSLSYGGCRVPPASYRSRTTAATRDRTSRQMEPGPTRKRPCARSRQRAQHAAAETGGGDLMARTVSQILVEDHHISLRPGAKGECPFCHLGGRVMATPESPAPREPHDVEPDAEFMTALAVLPPLTMISENKLAQMAGRHVTSVKRAIQ